MEGIAEAFDKLESISDHDIPDTFLGFDRTEKVSNFLFYSVSMIFLSFSRSKSDFRFWRKIQISPEVLQGEVSKWSILGLSK